MKTTMKSIMLTIVLSMTVAGVFAQTGQNATNQEKKQHDQDKVMPPPPPAPPAPPAPPYVEEEDAQPSHPAIPDLTDDQKQQLKKTDLKNLEAMIPLRNQMREKRVHLMTLLSTQPVNIKEAEQVADEIGRIQASILKQQIRHDLELRGILTPDQQIIFDSKPKPFLKQRMNPGRQD